MKPRKIPVMILSPVIAGALMLLLAGGITGAWHGLVGSGAMVAQAQDAPVTPDAAATPGAEPNVVTVELTEFEIRMPTELPAGETTFEVTNVGSVEHNFEVEGQGIEEVFEQNLQPGETRTMTLDLAPGTYEVYCPVGDHAEQGMRLELTVTDSGTPAAGTPGADDDEAAAEEVTVEMVDIDFNPNEFTIPADTDVTVHLPNRGETVHDFNIDDKNNPSNPDIHSGDVPPGEETTITLNLPPGDWYYYCSVPGHEAAGMYGTVHVEE